MSPKRAVEQALGEAAAEETASLTRAQILTQAGVSVLAQAHHAPSVALSLRR